MRDSILLCVLVIMNGLMLMPCIGAPASARAGFEVPLFVKEDEGVSRVAEPVAGGIPFPQGKVFNPNHLRLYGASKKAVPCQAHQLGICWPDGSLRWALVQFQASVGANKTATYNLRAEPSSPAPKPSSPVQVKDLGDVVQVSTRPMEFTVSRKDFRLPNTMKVDGVSVLNNTARIEMVADHEHMTKEEFDATGRDPKDLETFGLADTGKIKWDKIERGIDYSDRFTGPVDIQVEESGPLRAVLRIEKPGEKKAGDLGFVARLYAYAGKKLLRVELSVVNYDEFPAVPLKPGQQGWAMSISNTKHVRRYSYNLTPQLGKLTAIDVGVGEGTKDSEGSQSLTLTQQSQDAATMSRAGNKEELKGSSPGWIQLTGVKHSVALAGKYFSEVYPKALAYDASTGQLRFDFWPADAPGTGYPLAPGRMRTYEFLLGFDTPGAELSAMARAEVRPYPDPDYVANSGATHRFVPTTDQRFSKFASYVQRSYDAGLKNRLYGDIDYGDQIGWNADQRWNGYHGVTHEWFMFYLASGDPRYYRFAEADVWHSMDIDTFHWGPQRGLREAEYARKQDHICTSPIQGGIKVWNFGETDYYFLTGKRRVLENLRQNAHALLNCGGVVGGMTPERATSLPFLHLDYMYLALGSEEALAEKYPKAMHSAQDYPYRRDSIGVEESKPYLAKLKEMNDHFTGVYDRGEHMKCAFLASYPAEAYHRFYELTGDETAKEGLLKANDFLYNKLCLSTGALMYAGGAPWDALSIYMPWYDGVEAPSAMSYMVTKDKKYLDYGKAPVDYVLNIRGLAYSSGPWSFQGAMGFGGTLSTYLWAMRQAGMTQADLGKMRKDLDYDKALKDDMALCMSNFDAASKNSGESGTFCRLAAEVGRVLINLGRTDEAIEWLTKWQGKPYSVYVDWTLAYAKEVKEKAAAR